MIGARPGAIGLLLERFGWTVPKPCCASIEDLSVLRFETCATAPPSPSCCLEQTAIPSARRGAGALSPTRMVRRERAHVNLIVRPERPLSGATSSGSLLGPSFSHLRCDVGGQALLPP